MLELLINKQDNLKTIMLVENGILVEKAARVYYTHQGVSQRSEKLQCDTPFLMGKIRE